MSCSATTLLLSDWNDADPWSGTWKEQDTDEAANEYKLKQLGDTKLIGFIKSFQYGGMCRVLGDKYTL